MITIVTNTDNCLWQPNGWRGGYVMKQSCLDMMNKKISDLQNRLSIERQFYNKWLSEKINTINTVSEIIIPETIPVNNNKDSINPDMQEEIINDVIVNSIKKNSAGISITIAGLIAGGFYLYSRKK